MVNYLPIPSNWTIITYPTPKLPLVRIQTEEGLTAEFDSFFFTEELLPQAIEQVNRQLQAKRST